jgi:hypothetical protein
MKKGCSGEYGLKRNEETGGRRKLHIEELHNVYSSSRLIKMIKLRVRWAGGRT